MENVFSIGERVISLSNSPIGDGYQQREKGKIYEVKDVMYCSTNGEQLINLGQSTKLEKIKCRCGRSHMTHGLMWTYSKHFAKIDQSSLKEAVEEEDYELACIIRDNLKP